MNSIVLMAEISTEPEMRFTPDNLAISTLWVTFPNVRADDPPSKVKVAAFGELAQVVSETCHVGDVVTIEGQLHMNSIKREDGRSEKHAEINARRIYPLQQTLPVSLKVSGDGSASGDDSADPSDEDAPATKPARSQPARTPKADPQPNLDDIPF
jgi:single-stranded DNA-binding protein